jgi:hypothetical protein
MHRDVLHAVTLRTILIGAFCMCLAGFLRSALGQTNFEADITQPETLNNLARVGGPVRLFFFSLAAALLVLVAVLTVLRYRVGPSLTRPLRMRTGTLMLKPISGNRWTRLKSSGRATPSCTQGSQLKLPRLQP